MIVVSDTTPIIALLKVNRLTVLRDLYGYVIIPEAVLAELSNDAKFNKEAEYVEQSDFIEVQKVSEVDAVNIAQRFKALHQGEIEALALAQELDADLVLIDERSGRAAAHELGVKVSGTVGALKNAILKGLLSRAEAQACKEAFEDNNIYISDALYTWLLEDNSVEGR